MPETWELLLAACMFLGAALYTSVGHAGASAYIALMALFGLAPAVMRPTALALNILVASFTSYRYLQAGPVPLANAVAILDRRSFRSRSSEVRSSCQGRAFLHSQGHSRSFQ